MGYVNHQSNAEYLDEFHDLLNTAEGDALGITAANRNKYLDIVGDYRKLAEQQAEHEETVSHLRQRMRDQAEYISILENDLHELRQKYDKVILGVT